jgi:hypothetical protein
MHRNQVSLGHLPAISLVRWRTDGPTRTQFSFGAMLQVFSGKPLVNWFAECQALPLA